MSNTETVLSGVVDEIPAECQMCFEKPNIDPTRCRVTGYLAMVNDSVVGQTVPRILGNDRVTHQELMDRTDSGVSDAAAKQRISKATNLVKDYIDPAAVGIEGGGATKVFVRDRGILIDWCKNRSKAAIASRFTEEAEPEPEPKKANAIPASFEGVEDVSEVYDTILELITRGSTTDIGNPIDMPESLETFLVEALNVHLVKNVYASVVHAQKWILNWAVETYSKDDEMHRRFEVVSSIIKNCTKGYSTTYE